MLEALNFLLTNRIPRRLATAVAGRVAKIESRLLTNVGIRVWETFGGSLALDEAATSDFRSLQSVFTRRLKAGARDPDPSPDVLTSPCDAIVGAHGVVRDGMAIQAKGSWYSIKDLLLDAALVARHEGGRFVTLRLRSTMYHRFHAPCDGRVRSALWISGDTWNVNPSALRRVERLFCKNERVVLDLAPPEPRCSVTLVAVAAILVASVYLECLGGTTRGESGQLARHAIDAGVRKGDELGHFLNGSTIVLFASDGFEPCVRLVEGATVRAGEAILRRAGTRLSHVPSSPAPILQ
ncbi:MAG: archaetidylserine decarboxylase [Gemmatimonadaceae bacterium]